MMIPTLVTIAMVAGYLLGYCAGQRSKSRGLTVIVEQSRQDRNWIQHLMCAKLMNSDGEVVDYERVDMRDSDWEEQLAEGVARMKQKRNALKTLTKIAGE